MGLVFYLLKLSFLGAVSAALARHVVTNWRSDLADFRNSEDTTERAGILGVWLLTIAFALWALRTVFRAVVVLLG